MVLKSVRSIRKGKGDYGRKDLWKKEVSRLEWRTEGVMVVVMMMIINW